MSEWANHSFLEQIAHLLIFSQKTSDLLRKTISQFPALVKYSAKFEQTSLIIVTSGKSNFMAPWKTVTSWNYIGTGKEMKENVYWLFYARIKIVKLFVPKQDDVFVMLANVWHKIILLTSRL